MTGAPNHNWKKEFEELDYHWDLREDNIVSGESIVGTTTTTPQYLPWFHQRTVKLIADPLKYGFLDEGFQSSSGRERLLVISYKTF